MNYRHAFHAGSFGDVLKHIVLLDLIAALHRKAAPLHLLDSHAGIGLYDLASAEAQRGGEYRLGIGAVLSDPAARRILPDYLAALRELNPELDDTGAGLRRYPGSPWLLQRSLRAGDHLTLCELHPQDAQVLKRNIGRDPRVNVHHRDGFEALRALTPPVPRRGLALIDPAFEAEDESITLGKTVQAVHKRWATGLLAIWYPIKDQRETDRWKRELVAPIAAETVAVELTIRPAKEARQMNGCGLILVHPPWQVGETLQPKLDFLKARLAREAGAGARIETLVKAA